MPYDFYVCQLYKVQPNACMTGSKLLIRAEIINSQKIWLMQKNTMQMQYALLIGYKWSNVYFSAFHLPNIWNGWLQIWLIGTGYLFAKSKGGNASTFTTSANSYLVWHLQITLVPQKHYEMDQRNLITAVVTFINEKVDDDGGVFTH